jgi:hypothetical protein
MDAPPLACSLTAPELAARRVELAAVLRGRAAEVAPLADGYAFRYAADAAPLAELARLVDLERRCCPFLRFRLTVEPGGGPVSLELTGPAGTREMLAAELGLAG